MKLALYRLATNLGGPFIRLYLQRRMAGGREDRSRFEERLGLASLPRPVGPLVWLHGASVGEALSMLPLIARIRRDDPTRNILVTTGTVTSASLMADRLPDGALHQYVPVDRVAWVRQFLDHWSPDVALWMESELWPNLVLETAAREIPMVLVNGRMSDRSYAKWRRHPGLIRRLLTAFGLCLGQTDIDAERFAALGAPAVACAGNLKFAAEPLPANAAAVDAMREMTGDRPCWLAASTHAGEEAIAGRAHRAVQTTLPDLLTVVVPRHPERGASIAGELSDAGLVVARRSSGDVVTADTDIYLADTLGELGLFYRTADAVFMGKSMTRKGGQNPVEPARLGAALLYGPYMDNFSEIARRLVDEGGALQVANVAELAAALVRLLGDRAEAETMGARATAFAEREAGVIDRVYETLSPYFGAVGR